MMLGPLYPRANSDYTLSILAELLLFCLLLMALILYMSV